MDFYAQKCKMLKGSVVCSGQGVKLIVKNNDKREQHISWY